MMAHEVPLQVNQNDSSRTKTRKHKPVHQPKMQLPNGQKPNFGQNHSGKEKEKEKQRQGKKSQSSNGANSGGHEAKQSGNNNPGKKSKRPTNKKGNHDAESAGNQQSGQESYAGSSFHSSPEAVALPKPSFAKSSPEAPVSTIPTGQYQSPLQNVQRNVGNMSPAFVYQGMPSNGPPNHPVTLYPPTSRPGFEYHPNPQGFINYSYPPSAVPQPPLPMQSYPFQNYPPIPPPVQPQQFGQRITFNELMSSSKGVH